MYRLVIDTALDYSYLAILDNGNILYESYDLGKNNHSETLLPKLESSLKDLKLSLKDMEEVYVGIGPGSYTGVRIAVVIGKMLAAMNNIKLYSFSSLALLVSSIKHESYAFVDCRRGNAYSAHFDYKDNKTIRLSIDSVVEVSSYFKNISEDLIIKESKPDPVNLINSNLCTLVSDTNALSPNYLQLVEAERIKMGLK